jgi:hypothetical protein
MIAGLLPAPYRGVYQRNSDEPSHDAPVAHR